MPRARLDVAPRLPSIGAAGRLVRPIAISLGVVALGITWWGAVGGFSVDAYAYWRVGAIGPPYAIPKIHEEVGAFLYPPPAALAVTPFGMILPWEVFAALYALLLVGCVAWLVPPVWWLVAAAIALPEVMVGNIHILLAVALVAALRAPVAWAFPLLTKVTPGVGLLWVVGSRHWRDAAIALAVTAAIVAASVLVVPGWWSDWTARMLQVAGVEYGPEIPLPLAVRLPVAAIVALWGGVTGRAWALAPAAWIALPNVWWPSVAMLLAIPRLRHSSLS